MSENSFVILDATITDSIFCLDITRNIFEEIVYHYTENFTGAHGTTVHRVSNSIVLFGTDRVRVFNIETKQVLLDEPNPSCVAGVLNENTIVTISSNETFKLYDIYTGTHRYVRCEGLPMLVIQNSPLRINNTTICVYTDKNLYIVDLEKENHEIVAESIDSLANVYVWDGYLVIKAKRSVVVYDIENYYSKREYYGNINPLGIENRLLYCGINHSLMTYDLQSGKLTELYYFGPEDVKFCVLSNGYVQVSSNALTVYHYNIYSKDIKELEYFIYYGYSEPRQRAKPIPLLNRGRFIDVTF
jgi:WD40 repeat protein